jgi:hypothetical protein
MRTLIRILCAAMIVAPFPAGAADETPADARKAALQELNDYVGSWKGSGGPDKPRPGPKDPTWNEMIAWSWRFKGDDSWLSFEVKEGKYFRSGEVRYLPAKKAYQLTAVDAKKQKLEFAGKLDPKGYLVFERTEKISGETQQLTMNLAGDGVRFIYRYATRPKGGTVFNKQYMVAASKEGESLGATAKKNECVITGGLGTIPVTFMGETFYVCCTGCRDAFNEDPAKFVKEYKEKKKKN